MIDIIIPTFNQPQFLKQCLHAVYANTPTDFRLYIADDNSTDERMQDVFVGEHVLINHGERGFPSNCNSAVAKTDSEFICLLNSDTAAKPLWLNAMLDEMVDPSVGIVGAKLLYPADHKLSNGIQHAGIAHNIHGMPYHIYRGMDRNYVRANIRREINAVTFAAVLIRRSLWNELEGLDEEYRGGQFEDVDFCARARKAGWRIVYQPNAVLYHYEHGSGEEFVKQTATVNARLFVSKWGSRGSDEYLFGDTSLTRHREELAAFLHQMRAAAIRWAVQSQERSYIINCERLARLPFANIKPDEQDSARAMADEVIRFIGGLS